MISTETNVLPARTGASCVLTVSTSGSSGTLGEDLEHDRPWRRSRIRELVRLAHGGSRLLGSVLVAGVHVGERLPFPDGVAALLEAHDPDSVIDRILLRPPTCAQVQGRQPDPDGAERRDRSVARSGHSLHDRRDRHPIEVRIAVLGPDPPLVRVERGSALDRLLG